jgi:hypothetical protein
MKSKIYMNLLVVCIATIPSYDYCKGKQSADWQDKPLFKKAEPTQQPEEGQQDVTNDNKRADQAAWYKKPSVKYAVAGLFSAVVTGYSLYRYLQTPQVLAVDNNQAGVSAASNNSAIVETQTQDLTPSVQETVTGTEQKEITSDGGSRLSIAEGIGIYTVGLGIGTAILAVFAGINFVWQNGFPSIPFI